MREISSLYGHMDAETFLWSEKMVVAVRPHVDLNPADFARELVSFYAEVFADWGAGLVPYLCH